MGEPWDFEPVPLPGRIVAVGSGDHGEKEVLVACEPFTLKGGRFDALAGRHRYEGEGLDVLVSNGTLTCNHMAWRLADALKDDAWKDWRKAPGPGTIGSIELVRDGRAEPPAR